MDKETAYAKRKRLGLCAVCGKVPRPKDNSACLECRVKRNAVQAVIREKRKAKGVCVVCGKRAPNPGNVLCIECLGIRRQYNKDYDREGKCCRCNNPNDNGKKLCNDCRDHRSKENALNKQKIIEAYGGRCACCGEDNPIFLSVDHVNNDGKEHRKVIGRAGSSLYTWLVKHKFPKDNFQLLCFNCNLGKSINDGVCPHQQETGGIRGCGNGHLRSVKS